MGKCCAVFGCHNSTNLKKKNRSVNFILHQFPKDKDLITKASRKIWIARCQRKDKFNPDTTFICSDHFTENDYERDLRNELLGLPLRKVLKKTAVPTLGLYRKKPLAETKQELTKLLGTASLPSTIEIVCEDEDDQKNENVHVADTQLDSTSSIFNPPPDVSDYKMMYTELLKKYECLQKKYDLLKTNSEKQTEKLKTLMAQLKNCKNQSYQSKNVKVFYYRDQ